MWQWSLHFFPAVLTHKFNLTKPKYVICTRLFWERYGDILKGLDYIKTFLCFDGVDDLESVEALAKDVGVCAFEPAVVRGDDVAMIMYSSGTTGMCKGVQLTHLSLITRFQLCKHMYNCESLNVALILFVHTSSYTFTLTLYLLSAGKTVLYGGNDIKIAQDFKVGMIMTAPRFIQDNKILGQQDNVITSLKMLYTSSAAIPLQLEQNFRERYPEVKIVNTYGACESFVATSTRGLYDGSNAESGRVGVVLPGVAVKVVDVETRKALGPEQRGEICIRSPALMKGYLGAPSPVDHQGFYPTGDLGYYDKQKRFYLVDRLADMICYKGRKVSPKDIECVLQRHPAVSEVSVVGKPADGVIIELPVAFVVLKPGAAAAAEELQEYVDKQVTWYMQLHGGVRFLPELPRNPRGKVLRRRLREILALE
ncbi:uncharacterized protein LOC133532564 isoform X2 [Cydia pomonella]|uniref:uncharacterized protein LOC133532564 isoform X2 n=1 Tax=Cydia pomonella TaxID=82600 RepID=UPI002ADE300C|nr:uncharacterized protein LOC133532564 isoform X2 [Cydia pomonella]